MAINFRPKSLMVLSLTTRWENTEEGAQHAANEKFGF